MNGRTEVKGVARCLTKEVIMQAFSSLGTLDRSTTDLSIRSCESVAWGTICDSLLAQAWFTGTEIDLRMYTSFYNR